VCFTAGFFLMFSRQIAWRGSSKSLRMRGGDLIGGCGDLAYVSEVQYPREALEGVSGSEGSGFDG
jgi:hypothetical protein